MNLRNIEFGSAFCAAGTRNFDGTGWPYHRFPPWSGIDWSRTTLVTKTITFDPRPGNMPLKKDGKTPESIKPACIKVYPLQGITINAVGLSGPGCLSVMLLPNLRHHPKPFWFSFMAVKPTLAERVREAMLFAQMLVEFWPPNRRRCAIEVNFSCPNVAHGGIDQGSDDWFNEIEVILTALSRANVPLIPNFSVETKPEFVARVMKLPMVDAVSVANTVRWSSPLLDRMELFGTETSPLEKLGGGGVSGPPLFPLLLSWLGNASRCGLTKPLVVGGGVFSSLDVQRLHHAGGNLIKGVKIGTVALHRPWRVNNIIREICVQFGGW